MTVLSGEAAAEILSLYGRYAHYYDSGRAEDFAGLFTRDGVVVHDGAEQARGPDAIADMVRRGTTALPGIRHLISSIVLDPAPGDDSRARGTAYVQAVICEAMAVRLVTQGRYTDVFAHEEGHGASPSTITSRSRGRRCGRARRRLVRSRGAMPGGVIALRRLHVRRWPASTAIVVPVT